MHDEIRVKKNLPQVQNLQEVNKVTSMRRLVFVSREPQA